MDTLYKEKKIYFNTKPYSFYVEADKYYKKYKETIYNIILNHINTADHYSQFINSRILVKDAKTIFNDIFKQNNTTKKPLFVNSHIKQLFDMALQRLYEENGLSLIPLYEIRDNNFYLAFTLANEYYPG
jgi:hypothetical protein